MFVPCLGLRGGAVAIYSRTMQVDGWTVWKRSDLTTLHQRVRRERVREGSKPDSELERRQIAFGWRPA